MRKLVLVGLIMTLGICVSVSALPSYEITYCDAKENCTSETSELPVRHVDVSDYKLTASTFVSSQYDVMDIYGIDITMERDAKKTEKGYYMDVLTSLLQGMPGTWQDLLLNYEALSFKLSSTACESYGCDEVESTTTKGSKLSMKQTITTPTSNRTMNAALAHELGHAFYNLGYYYYKFLPQNATWDNLQSAFLKASGGKYPGSDDVVLDEYASYFISRNAASSVEEDFADTFMNYLLDYMHLNDVEISWNEATRAKTTLMKQAIDALCADIEEHVTYSKNTMMYELTPNDVSTNIHDHLRNETSKKGKSKLEEVYSSEYRSNTTATYLTLSNSVLYKENLILLKEADYLKMYRTFAYYYWALYVDSIHDSKSLSLNEFYEHIGNMELLAYYVEDLYYNDIPSVYSFYDSLFAPVSIIKKWVTYLVEDDEIAATAVSEAYESFLTTNKDKKNQINVDKTILFSVDNLKPYSAMDMNVYPSSRVTSIQSVPNGFKINGYMFESDANCTASLWREVIFVNSEDVSPSKAYRKQVTPIYSTWLNSNKNATNNGRYTLNYANYTITITPNSVNGYEGNIPTTMAKGNYYILMRISNGSKSYLFPLTDTTLSDGTNLENTNKLPSGISVYDRNSRALMYSVK